MLRTFTAFMAAGSFLLLSPAATVRAADNDMEVLTRGPVHEAFAESVTFEAQPGIIVSVKVPDPIEEMPPDQQPEGDNVSWIPGYWAWDDEQNDFIWISGIWRNLPPGRQWVPGYWSEIDGARFQWTSGYWADSTVKEVEYVSTAPPRSIDTGPNIAAPSNNHTWIPGYWNWVDARYVWRPGYWEPLRVNWTWVPSRYNWTHSGYVYVDGYWDYAVASRGVLFAPVYSHNHAYYRPDYYYTPSIVVSLGVFSDHLFVRPNYGHYYFGDYYAPHYAQSGFYASYSWHSGHHGYDPIYAYDRWDHRGDATWDRRRRDNFNYFRDNENARPPRTWAAMSASREDQFADGRNRRYASSLQDYANDGKSGRKFRKLDETGRKQIVSQRQEIRKFGQERRQLETRGKTAAGTDSQKSVSRKAISRSPITGRDADRLTGDDAPPKRPQGHGDKTRATSDKKSQPGTKDKARDEMKPQEQDKGKGKADRETSKPDTKPRESGKADRPGSKKETDGVNQAPKKKAQQPQAEPKRKAQQQQAEPKRKAQQQQAEPKREAQSNPKAHKGPAARMRTPTKSEQQSKPTARKASPEVAKSGSKSKSETQGKNQTSKKDGQSKDEESGRKKH